MFIILFLLGILFVAILLNNLLYLINLRKLIKYMSDSYPERLSELGISPKLFLGNSPGNSANILKFVKSEGNENDPIVQKGKQVCKQLLYFGYYMFVAFVLLLVCLMLVVNKK